MTDTSATPVISTSQIISAIAASLLPLVGPIGIQAAQIVPALEQMLDSFRNVGDKDYSVDDLVAIVQNGDMELAQLQRDRAAQKALEGGGTAP